MTTQVPLVVNQVDMPVGSREANPDVITESASDIEERREHRRLARSSGDGAAPTQDEHVRGIEGHHKPHLMVIAKRKDAEVIRKDAGNDPEGPHEAAPGCQQARKEGHTEGTPLGDGQPAAMSATKPNSQYIAVLKLLHESKIGQGHTEREARGKGNGHNHGAVQPVKSLPQVNLAASEGDITQQARLNVPGGSVPGVLRPQAGTPLNMSSETQERIHGRKSANLALAQTR